MKKRLSFAILTVFILLGIGVLTGQVPGKYLGFTADRYWDNTGVIKTDGGIILTGATPLSFTTEFAPAGTAGSLITTGTSWLKFSTAGAAGVKMLLANTSATGNFASIRIRGRSDVATPTWNQNTVAGDFSASAGINDYGELVGVSAYAQVPAAYTQSRGNHWITGLKAALTDYAGATSAGSRFVMVLDDACVTKASTAHYMMHMTKAAGVAIDGAFQIEPTLMTYLFDFTADGGFLLDSGTSHTQVDGSLTVHTPDGVKYINLYN
jgi:hypothetical protein